MADGRQGPAETRYSAGTWQCIVLKHILCYCRLNLMLLQVEIWQTVDRDQLRRDLQLVLDKGIRSLAVTLMHSYMYVPLLSLLPFILSGSRIFFDCTVCYSIYISHILLLVLKTATCFSINLLFFCFLSPFLIFVIEKITGTNNWNQVKTYITEIPYLRP